jgi:hypothetical protein
VIVPLGLAGFGLAVQASAFSLVIQVPLSQTNPPEHTEVVVFVSVKAVMMQALEPLARELRQHGRV